MIRPFLALLFVIIAPLTAQAQLSVDEVGIDPTTNLTYSCIRYTESFQNTIGITDENGDERFLTPEAAAEELKPSIRRVNQRRKQRRKRLRQVTRQIRRIGLIDSLRPAERKRLRRLKKLRKKTRRQLNRLNSLRKNLISLRETLRDCREEQSEDEIISGGLTLVSRSYKTISDEPDVTRFWVGTFFVLARPAADFDQFCVQYSTFPGVNKVTVRRNTCASQNVDGTCALEIDVNGFQVGRGYTGKEDPGTCFPPEACSRSEALKKLSEGAARFGDVTVLGKARSGSCSRFE